MSGKEYTQNEIMNMFLGHFSQMVDYWAEVENKDAEAKLSGFAFSILSMLDGCSADMPSFELIPHPHPDDKEYLQKEGRDWYPDPPDLDDDVVTVHGDNMLHERWHAFREKGKV